MRANYKVLTALILATASLGCAHAQSVAPAGAPSDAPATKNVPRTETRLRSVVSPATTPPGSYNPNYQAAVEQTRAAVAQYGAVVGQIGSSFGGSTRSSSDSVPPVVIQFGSKDANAVGAMEEDLAIMTHIVDRALDRMGEDDPERKLGVPIYYTSGGRSVRALYLEGFGPLFMVKVNFPVHGASTTEAKTVEKPDDSEWEDARRRVYGASQDTAWVGSSSGVPYEAARVDALKKNLVHALKNASNMKGVKADEFVNVTVFGSPSTAIPESDWPANNTSNRFEKRNPAAAVRTALQGTVLTLRAKKSDVDAAAKGSLDDDAFGKKVAVTTYTGNGYGLTSVNSWIRKSSTSSSAVAR
jgi:hypothetical protein